MKPITGTLVKSLVFVVVTVLATGVLAATIRNTGASGADYTAYFTDATSLNKGDDVRMAGVRIGRVEDVAVQHHRTAKVELSIDPAVRINRGSIAQLRFRNLVGQRYVSLQQGDGAGWMLPGATFDLDHTRPALNLTMLFNGFSPLFRLLSPKDVNRLSGQIISVFQGEGSTVDGLLTSTARLTQTLAAKDKVIGQLIDNLTDVLTTVNARSGQLSTTIVTLQRLVTGLAQDRKVIGSTLDGFSALTVSVSDLLREGRAPLKRSIDGLGRLSDNLAANEPALTRFLDHLPSKLDRIGTLASYGSWLNFYVCSIDDGAKGAFPQPEGYVGDYGAKPVAGRCSA